MSFRDYIFQQLWQKRDIALFGNRESVEPVELSQTKFKIGTMGDGNLEKLGNVHHDREDRHELCTRQDVPFLAPTTNKQPSTPVAIAVE